MTYDFNAVKKRAEDCRNAIITLMKENGYYARVFNGDNTLNRVKQFLLSFQDSQAMNFDAYDEPSPKPRLFPLFPDIKNAIFHDINGFPEAKILEKRFVDIKQDALRLEESNHEFINFGIREMIKSSWQVHLLTPLQQDTLQEKSHLCSSTIEILSSLPNRCQIYPWGDGVFSALNPGAHIPAHYSVDNFHVRCMLGIIIPEKCSMRVGNRTTEWQEGKTLFFEDSFEHEVWNRSQSRRIILIQDFWHPDLTMKEKEILNIGFSHPRIRHQIYIFLGNEFAQYTKYLNQMTYRLELPNNYFKYWDEHSELYN